MFEDSKYKTVISNEAQRKEKLQEDAQNSLQKGLLALGAKRIGGLADDGLEIDICLFTTHGILLTPSPSLPCKEGS